MTAQDHLGQQFPQRRKWPKETWDALKERRQVPLSEIHSAWANDFDDTRVRDLPNVLDQARVGKMARSLSRHGMVRPIDLAAPNPEEPDYQLLEGHHRVAGAQKIGMKTIPANVHKPVKEDWGYDYPTFTPDYYSVSRKSPGSREYD